MGIDMSKMSIAHQSVEQWRKLHDHSYFDRHPRYQGLPANSGMGDLLREYVGLHESESVLEIGCGYGGLMQDIADDVRTIHGVDVHEAPIAQARTFLAEKANAHVAVYDGVTLPFEAGAFTVVYCFLVLQHLPRAFVPLIIAEAYRVLADGGRMCMQTYGGDPNRPTNNQHRGDIDLTISTEQSLSWTPDAFAAAADGLPLRGLIVRKYGLSLILTGTR